MDASRFSTSASLAAPSIDASVRERSTGSEARSDISPPRRWRRPRCRTRARMCSPRECSSSSSRRESDSSLATGSSSSTQCWRPTRPRPKTASRGTRARWRRWSSTPSRGIATPAPPTRACSPRRSRTSRSRKGSRSEGACWPTTSKRVSRSPRSSRPSEAPLPPTCIRSHRRSSPPPTSAA